jgi:hypothetical protein
MRKQERIRNEVHVVEFQTLFRNFQGKTEEKRLNISQNSPWTDRGCHQAPPNEGLSGAAT